MGAVHRLPSRRASFLEGSWFFVLAFCRSESKPKSGKLGTVKDTYKENWDRHELKVTLMPIPPELTLGRAFDKGVGHL